MRAVDTGEITAIALMGTDVERIGQGFLSVHDLWGSLVEIAVAVWLLQRQLSLAAIAPVVVVIGMYIGRAMRRYTHTYSLSLSRSLSRALSLSLLIEPLVFIACTFQLANRTKYAQRAWIEKVQERLRVTSSMLSDMKAVKMPGLSAVMSTIIQRARKDEIRVSGEYRKFLTLKILLCETEASGSRGEKK